MKQKFRESRILRILSLFSGAGGFDLGFRFAGNFETVFANELLDAPAKTFSRNFGMNLATPEKFDYRTFPIVVQGDVRDIDFSRFSFHCDVIIGGPPCQDFSVLKGSTRRGIETKRGKLYLEFLRAVACLHPKVVVFENVPGLISANSGRAFKTILNDFQNLGSGRLKGFKYEVVFSKVVDASHFGVPQRRKRLILIAIRKDLTESVGFFEMERRKLALKNILSGEKSLFRKYPITCMEVLEGKVLADIQEKYRQVMLSYKDCWKDLSSLYTKEWLENVWCNLKFDVIADYLFVNGVNEFSWKEFETAMEEHLKVLKKLGFWEKPVYGLNPSDGSNEIPHEDPLVLERMKHIPPSANYEFVRGTKYEVKGRMSSIYKRPFPLKPAPTVIAYGGGGTWGYHYERSRGKLTNRERARFQTFTDNFLFEGPSSSVRAQIGEAVPPLMAYSIAEAVLEVFPEILP